MLNGGGNSSGFSMEKSLSWLSLMLGIVAGVFLAPVLIRHFLTPVKDLLISQGVSVNLSSSLGWLVIVVLTIATVFLVHATLTGFLLRRAIRRMSS